MSDDVEGPANAFRLPEEGEEDPRPIVRRLVDELEEFNDLLVGEAVIMVVFRTEGLIKAGRQILGTMALPRWQGQMAPLALWLLAKACGGTVPDFIMTLDAEWWAQATPLQREALVYHELCHAEHAKTRDGDLRFTEEGLPVWAIRGHDIEEFQAVVRRYGAWSPDITAFIDAARAGGAV